MMNVNFERLVELAQWAENNPGGYRYEGGSTRHTLTRAEIDEATLLTQKACERVHGLRETIALYVGDGPYAESARDWGIDRITVEALVTLGYAPIAQNA